MCGSNLHEKLGLEGVSVGSKKIFTPVLLLGTIKIIKVACGDYHTMCLSQVGQIYVWGGSWKNVSCYKFNNHVIDNLCAYIETWR